MSEQRFTFKCNNDNCSIFDNGVWLKIEEIVDVMNEQQATISQLTTKCSRLAKEKDELSDEIGHLNNAWSDKVGRLLDFVEGQGQVSRQDIKDWWNDE